MGLILLDYPWGSTFYYDPVSDSIFSGFNDLDRAGVPALEPPDYYCGYVIKELAMGILA
jgi:hypothetical protein